jgi:transposase
MLKPAKNQQIPEKTREVAWAAFPKGAQVMVMRDELGPIFEDKDFAELFSWTGQPGISPAQLAMVTVMQYIENLTDRQTADAVRARIDWKYALGLDLEDAGFNYSVLSEFRTRLIAGEKDGILLNAILACCAEKGLLGGKKLQRTDSTHVLAAVRNLNTIEIVGESMRRALDEIAVVAPSWLEMHLQPEWLKRYGRPIDTLRLPKRQGKQIELVKAIGYDGYGLLKAIYETEGAPPILSELRSVDVLRQVWVQWFYCEEEQIHWRTRKGAGLPPAHRMITSPDDLEARYTVKREMPWVGYKVHVTETCDPDHPRLLTQVETTPATTHDIHLAEPIQKDLFSRGLGPDTMLVDSGYIEADLLVSSMERGVGLVGPAPANKTWQAKDEEAFDHTRFVIDWENMVATCPAGQQSDRCHRRKTRRGTTNWIFAFNLSSCGQCSLRARCTTAQKSGRSLTVYPPEQYQALQAAREREDTEEYQQLYAKRAGVEGTISQAVRTTGLRRSRYRGLARTRLQHLASAAALNVIRSVAWLRGERPVVKYVSPFVALASQAAA